MIGKQMKQTIIINAIVPIIFAYGDYLQIEKYKNRAMALLTQIPPEKNNITRKWAALNISIPTALQSQALLHLKSMYCSESKCTRCNIGNEILKS